MKPGNLVNYKSYQKIINKYIFASKFAAGKTILDIGCNNGYGTVHLKNKGTSDIIGVDVDRECIEYAVKHYPDSGANFMCANSTILPFTNNKFDIVVAFDVIEHISNYEEFLSETSRVLTDQGIFILSTPNKEAHFSLVKPRDHVYEFSKDELYNLLANYYGDLSMYGQIMIEPGRLTRMKYRNMINAIIGSAILSIPLGTQFKRILTRFITRENRLVKFSDNFDEIADAKYEPISLCNSSKFAMRLVTIAQKRL
jgi:ubiquinone/menaquinone biosynthesis C-methylase UbiE